MEEAVKGSSFLVEDASVVFDGVAALQNVNLNIGSGEAVALVGPSGAGKSTLLYLLNAAISPTSGQVSVDGRVLAGLSFNELRGVRSEIGFVYQRLNLVPSLRVLQNVIAGRLGSLSCLKSLFVLLFPPMPIVEEAYRVLERVGIEDKLYQRTDTLSGGEQQRVAIARALFQKPRALLPDEPVSSVDPARAKDTVKLFIELCRERKMTLCMSIHNIELARTLFPRLVGLRRGQIVFDCLSSEIDNEQLVDLYQLDEKEILAYD